ncbi:MAG: iron(III) transport system permease protein, partial [Actinomycetota bacterium]|nr:iron(III) transport system permease protein [Actinomycetota bacterium]
MNAARTGAASPPEVATDFPVGRQDDVLSADEAIVVPVAPQLTVGAGGRWTGIALPRRALRTIQPLTLFWLLIVLILVFPIVLFLTVAFSPALLDQGTQAFTFESFHTALSGQLFTGFLNSLVVGISTAVVSAAIGFGLAWVVLRTNAPGRRIWTGVVFALLLVPSYLIALGWERLLEPNGVLEVIGLNVTWARDILYGPVGVVIVLTVKGVPFAYLAIANALRGLGHEFEDAVRVHGGSRLSA